MLLRIGEPGTAEAWRRGQALLFDVLVRLAGGAGGVGVVGNCNADR